MPEILIAEEHDRVYQVLLDRKAHNISVVHIDFHCDMRGLMIDRLKNRAYMASRYEAGFIDDGNFLSHAIMNGIVSSIRWVHDHHGGRRYDFGATVKYESDTAAFLHDFLHRLRRTREVAIAFDELSFQEWDGIHPGEVLDIDWDAIASVEYQPFHARKLMDAFLNREFPVIPETTFLAFSPEYSIPDRAMFEEFVSRLKEKFSAHVASLPKATPPPESPPHDRASSERTIGIIHGHLPKTFEALAYRILARMHARDTRHDLDHRSKS